MELTFKSKFNVGEIVKVRGANQRFIINNVLSETCTGGTQILYAGVILIKKDVGIRIEKTSEEEFLALLDKPLTVNENFLEAIAL